MEDANAPTYFYVDPNGIERGPFEYGRVLAWFRAGYLAPNLGCRRSDEQSYARTVTEALIADGSDRGVSMESLARVVATSGSGQARQGVGSGTPAGATVRVPPPPPSRSEEEITQCVERLMEVLDHVLPIVLEGGLREEFGEVWADMLHTPPPWTLETTLRELKANWGSLFSSQPRRTKEIETLLDAAVRQRKNLAIAPGSQSREVSAAAVSLISACPKTFPPAVIEHLRVAWEECERIRAYLHA